MREAIVERKVSEKLRKSGWKVIKAIQLSENGWPDRFLFRYPARLVFVEWKRDAYTDDKGKFHKREEVDPEGLQAFRHKQLREMGFEVIVAWSEKEVQHLL